MLKFLGATALHKFVISFSVGMELVSNKVIQFTYFPSEYWCMTSLHDLKNLKDDEMIKVSLMMYCISIVVFSLAPALGSAIGIILTEVS